MRRRSASAPNDSSRMTHMTSAFARANRLAAAPILGSLSLLIALLAAACSSTPPPTAPRRRRPSRHRARNAQSARAARRPGAATIDRPRARWIAARWSDLPGWSGDRVGEFWPAFLRSCERPAAPWLAVCAAARADASQRRLPTRRCATGCSSTCARTASSRWRATRPAWRPATSSRWSRPRASRAADFASPSTGRRPTWRRGSPTGRASSSRRCRRRKEPARQRDRLGARPARRAAAAGARLGSARLRRCGRRRQGRAGRLRRAQRPAVPVDRPLADRPGRVARERGLVAFDPRLGAAEPGPGRRDDPQQPARRLLPRGAACPIRRSARRARRAFRSRRAARSPSIRRAFPTARPSGSTPASRSRPGRCAASSSPRTPARRSSARSGPTTSGAGATTPRPQAGRMKQPLRMWALWPAS